MQKSLHQPPPVDLATTAPPGRPPPLLSISYSEPPLFNTLTSILSGAPAITHSLSEPLHFISEPLNRYYTYTVHSSKLAHSSLGEALTIVRILSFTRSSLSILGGGTTNNKQDKGGGAVAVRPRTKHTQAY